MGCSMQGGRTGYDIQYLSTDVRVGHKEGWVPKKWCFSTVVPEKTLESPLGSKEMKPVNPKGNQPWKDWCWSWSSNTWPPDAKNWFIGKDPDAGKDWRQEEKGTTKEEMAGWHHWLSGHELSKLQEMVMDKEAWHAAVHGVTKNWTRLSDWTTTYVWEEARVWAHWDHSFHMYLNCLGLVSSFSPSWIPFGCTVWGCCKAHGLMAATSFVSWCDRWHILSTLVFYIQLFPILSRPHFPPPISCALTGSCCFSIPKSCPTLCNPMDWSMPGSSVHHYFLEFAQMYFHRVTDAIWPSHPLPPTSFAFRLPRSRVFSNKSALRIRWRKYWSFSFTIGPSNEYSGLISFSIDWFDLLEVQGTLKSLLQHYTLKASIL